MIQDEGRIKDLSEQANEKTKKILNLQRELQEAHADNISNEAKMLELRDQLTQSKSKIAEIKSSMEPSSDSAEDSRLTLANIELEECKEEIREKTELISELERKLNTQMNEQHKEAEMRMKEVLTVTEVG